MCRAVTTTVILSVLAWSLSAHAQGDKGYTIRERTITDGDRDHWSFRPLKRPPVPVVENRQYVRNDIDAFIVAGLEAEGLQPLPEAGRATLLRRLYFDLVGLPPSAAEVDAFLKDSSPTAYEKVVDRLLASPAHGERWAQHWLDLARFAETDGFEHDYVRKESWRYRDWVIDAINSDVPYDAFVRLQIAGDEIRPNTNDTNIATGFLVSGPDMPDINLQDERRHVLLNEMTSTVGSVFLGLTLECAQCHDHRFDAISQADFYRFRAFFANALPKMSRGKQMPASVSEPGRELAPTHFMIRGNFLRPGPRLQPAYLRIADLKKHEVPAPKSKTRSSMRRSELARWLTAADNPLTARVMVNRVWMHHFGKGLCNTPSDVGIMGEQPTHPELLDYLATELIRNDWSLRKLHRLIVTSAAYRRASKPGDSEWPKEVARLASVRWKQALAKDADNNLLARRSRIRLDGEALRDAMLVSAGKLNPARGGPGVRPPLPKELVETLLRDQWKVSPDKDDHYRRSIYIFARRNLRYPIFEAFDRPDGNASCSRRSKSTTAPQALIMLNSEFSAEMAATLAESLQKDHASRQQRVHAAFRRILSRDPTPSELQTSINFLQRHTATLPKTNNQHEALTDFCLALFNVNEFVYID